MHLICDLPLPKGRQIGPREVLMSELGMTRPRVVRRWIPEWNEMKVLELWVCGKFRVCDVIFEYWYDRENKRLMICNSNLRHLNFDINDKGIVFHYDLKLRQVFYDLIGCVVSAFFLLDIGFVSDLEVRGAFEKLQRELIQSRRIYVSVQDIWCLFTIFDPVFESYL